MTPFAICDDEPACGQALLFACQSAVPASPFKPSTIARPIELERCVIPVEAAPVAGYLSFIVDTANMSCTDMTIRLEREPDLNQIRQLHEEAFGPGRFAKTAYRVREGVTPVSALSLVAVDAGQLVGSIRFTRVSIAGRGGALLLGPLAVFRAYGGHRCGLRLMEEGLQKARQQGFFLVILVGDLVYYQKVGFRPVPADQILMPGPLDPQRLLAFELQDNALEGYAGQLKADG